MSFQPTAEVAAAPLLALTPTIIGIGVVGLSFFTISIITLAGLQAVNMFFPDTICSIHRSVGHKTHIDLVTERVNDLAQDVSSLKAACVELHTSLAQGSAQFNSNLDSQVEVLRLLEAKISLVASTLTSITQTSSTTFDGINERLVELSNQVVELQRIASAASNLAVPNSILSVSNPVPTSNFAQIEQLLAPLQQVHEQIEVVIAPLLVAPTPSLEFVAPANAIPEVGATLGENVAQATTSLVSYASNFLHLPGFELISNIYHFYHMMPSTPTTVGVLYGFQYLLPKVTSYFMPKPSSLDLLKKIIINIWS
ncbi:hypothetical protein [Phenylobacterium aquaticum]|uniref:hypothetical protein n=1 Tax=Phenylobacterium aquaticum TaxID=1763816 RepID=UPI0026ED26AF|nr:hypothetical protein [Phenylobacterium aquaticum]